MSNLVIKKAFHFFSMAMYKKFLIVIPTLGSALLASCADHSLLIANQDKAGYKAIRFAQNPIITPAMLGKEGDNINGPSLIRAPDWLPQKLGKYYLYFAHHEGEHLRLAYADDLKGPWKIYPMGVIPTKDLAWKPDHIASPDVLVDDDRHEIRLYFHSPVTPAPKSSDPDYRKKLEQTIRKLNLEDPQVFIGHS